MTQNQAILNALMKGGITTLDAFKLGITRLSGRIYDLRQQGVRIESKRKQVKSRWGKTTVAEYRLKGKKP